MRAHPTRLAALGAALALAGCALAHRMQFERPTVDLVEVQITGIGLSGGQLNLILDVRNPNAYDLRMVRVRAGIDLGNTHFGDAALEQPATFPAGQDTRIAVPLAFTWSGVGAGARALLTRGGADYRLTGDLEIDTPVGSRGMDLAMTGTVTLRDLVH